MKYLEIKGKDNLQMSQKTKLHTQHAQIHIYVYIHIHIYTQNGETKVKY